MDDFDAITHVVPPGAFECPSCNGVGTYDETLGGVPYGVTNRRCPDCDGDGHFFPSQEVLDAIAWRAYSKAWPEAMVGRHLHVRGWQQPRVSEYARPQGLD